MIPKNHQHIYFAFATDFLSFAILRYFSDISNTGKGNHGMGRCKQHKLVENRGGMVIFSGQKGPPPCVTTLIYRNLAQQDLKHKCAGFSSFLVSNMGSGFSNSLP
ncbi:MAG: hypothetical protein ACOCUL_03545, partial [Bacteroidota bacterium]